MEDRVRQSIDAVPDEDVRHTLTPPHPAHVLVSTTGTDDHGSVDRYTIAFGLRNVSRPDRALAEARRVLKPGGRLVCLEFSRVALPWLARLYDLYSFQVLPALGAVVAGDADAYRYLAESIRRFPPQDELAALMTAAGLEQVRYRNLSGGIAALHSAWRL